MKPFLLLCVRPESDAAADEHAAMRQGMGLSEHELRMHRLTEQPLPALDLDDWSGIVIGGGPFNASDAPESKSPLQQRVEAQLSSLLDRILAVDFPLLGACYGVGVVGSHGGGLIDRTYAESVGRIEVRLSDEASADPLFSQLPTRFEAFVGHKEAVSRLPEGAVLLASSQNCPVQAFRMRANTYVTQFHPELDSEALCERITIYQHAGYFEPHELDSLKEMARSRPVDEPQHLLRLFAERYSR